MRPDRTDSPQRPLAAAAEFRESFDVTARWTRGPGSGKLRTMVIRDLSDSDVESVVALSFLFDDEALVDATRRFIDDPGHHLLVAYDEEVPVGFVTGVEMTHPDKGTEMFLYELGVDEPARGRGAGRALVGALAEKARSLGCTGMWVLTDEDNAAALRAYEAAGGVEPSRQTMISWTFEPWAPHTERVTGIEPA